MEREEKQSSDMNLLSFCDRYKTQKESKERSMFRIADFSYMVDNKLIGMFENVQIQFCFPVGQTYGELSILDKVFNFKKYYSYFRTDFQKFVYDKSKNLLIIEGNTELIIEGNTESKEYKTYTVTFFNVRVVDN